MSQDLVWRATTIKMLDLNLIGRHLIFFHGKTRKNKDSSVICQVGNMWWHILNPAFPHQLFWIGFSLFKGRIIDYSDRNMSFNEIFQSPDL
jgi:hypothetical protein